MCSRQDSDFSFFLFTFSPFSLTLACSLQLSLSFWNRIKTPAAWLAKVRQLWPISPLSLACSSLPSDRSISTSLAAFRLANSLPVRSRSRPCLNLRRFLRATLNVDTFSPAVERFNTCHPASFCTPSYALGFGIPWFYCQRLPILNSWVDSLSAFHNQDMQ